MFRLGTVTAVDGIVVTCTAGEAHVLTALNVPLTSVLNDSRMTVRTRRVVLLIGIEPASEKCGSRYSTLRSNHGFQVVARKDAPCTALLLEKM